MKLMDKVIMSNGDTLIDDIFFLKEMDGKYIFSTAENLVDDEGLSILWVEIIGTKAIRPLKSNLNYIQIDDNTYLLNVAEYIDAETHSMNIF